MTFWFSAGVVAIATVAVIAKKSFVWEWLVCDFTTNINLKELPNLLTTDECDTLIRWIQTHKTDTSEVEKGFLIPKGAIQYKHRKSNQCWLSARDHPIVSRLRDTLQPYLKGTSFYFEALQLAHYKTGGYFKPHYDTHIEPWKRKNRTATVLIYLNDNYDGGETRFPYLNRTIRPKKGDGVYFNTLLPTSKNPKVLWYSKHEGCEVKRGEKYIATVWVYEKI